MRYLDYKDIPKTLKEYFNYTFDTASYRTDEYISFEKKYHNYLKKLCTENGYELAEFHPMHFEFSCFIKKDDNYIYLSIPDVRYFKNEWANDILVRRALNTNDYHGGHNNSVSFTDLKEKINYLFSLGKFTENDII